MPRKLMPIRKGEPGRYVDRRTEAARLAEECYQAIHQVLSSSTILPEGQSHRIAEEASDSILLEVDNVFRRPSKDAGKPIHEDAPPAAPPEPRYPKRPPKLAARLAEANKRQVQTLMRNRRDVDKRKHRGQPEVSTIEEYIRSNNTIVDGGRPDVV